MSRKQKKAKPKVSETVTVDYYAEYVYNYFGYSYSMNPPSGFSVMRYTRYIDDTSRIDELARFRSKEHADWFLTKVRGGC